MSLTTLREAIRTRLSAGVDDLVDVHTFGGRFDVVELKRWALKAPCALVALLGIRDVALEGGQLKANLHLGVFVIAADRTQVKRDALALTLVEAALNVIRPEQDWGINDASHPNSIRADNLFSGQLDQQGVALWAISWQQSLDINVFDSSALDDLLTYNVEYDLAEADDSIDAEDTVTLEGP